MGALAALALGMGILAASPEEPPRKPNRLAGEKSPYLLQHAHNPVDWYPWGPEAFEKAKREDRPVFLSIGYSTCHWCHVMERESFEDAEIAAFLNEHFISIKVDREERPDIDSVYMEFVQASTGSGGWPLTAFLTPDGKPFFGGTYFPPRDDPRRGTGFLHVIQQVQKHWKEGRERVVESAGAIQAELARRAGKGPGAGGTLDKAILRKAHDLFRAGFDEDRGGFAGPPTFAPKFPRTSTLDFLLRFASLRGAPEDAPARAEAIRMVHATLEGMIRGGIRDHLAGGFHRYSTDREWLVPHFEKMLYDQALIARSLADAWRVSGKDVYLETARETLDYVLGRMSGPDGEIYSAEDADTEGEEGKTYVWRRAEVLDGLGKERGERFAAHYGVTEEGNFEEGGKGACILHLANPGALPELSRTAGKTVEDLARELAESRAKLLAIRDRRPQPLRDDKVIVEWNGLAISALSHVYQVSGERRYLDAARRAASFILERMSKEGKLLRRYRQGEAAIDAFLEDYAFFIEGLIDLYESSFERRWLEEAVRLGRQMVSLFWDAEGGAFFSSSRGHEALIIRTKEFYDGAVPSGNSVAFLDLLRLAELTQDAAFQEKARSFEKVASAVLAGGADAYPRLLCAAHFVIAGPKEIVLAGPASDPVFAAFQREVHARFLPAKVLIGVASVEEASALSKVVPLAESKGPIGGKPAAFVCKQGVCKLPATDIEVLRAQLAE